MVDADSPRSVGHSAGTDRAWPRGFFHPHVQLALGVALVTASELFLKHGAEHAERLGHADWTGLAALRSWWVWIGIICYIASFLSWLHVLRFVPLVLAFNVMNLVHVTIPLGAMLVLGERLPPARIGGIVLIIAGVGMLAPALAKLETIARERGTAVGIASALPISIERLTAWSKALEARGVMLVPLTTAMLKSKSN